MTFASKTTFCLNDLKILRLKVTKILQICLRNFCEFPHWCQNVIHFHPQDLERVGGKMTSLSLLFFRSDKPIWWRDFVFSSFWVKRLVVKTFFTYLVDKSKPDSEKRQNRQQKITRKMRTLLHQTWEDQIR